MDLLALFRLYEDRVKRFEPILADAPASMYDERSPVWKGFMAKRPSLATLTDILTMFSGHSPVFGSAAGGTPDITERKTRFELQVDRFGALVSAEDANRIPRSIFGAPWVHEVNGYVADEWFIYNAGMAGLVLQTLKALNFPTTNLRTLEIGSGYGGMATILLQQDFSKHYDFMDLHENLFLALIYMGFHHPDFATRIIPEPQSTDAKQFNFYLPHYADAAIGPYDFAVNTSSLGEMPRDTAAAYVRLVAKCLRPGGLFLSHNAVGSYAPHYKPGEKAGFTAPARISDYGYLTMEIKHFRPTPVPGGIDHEMHHLVVCTPKSPTSPVQSAEDFDVLGFLLNCAVTAEAEALCDSFVQGSINTEQRVFLNAVQKMFQATTTDEKFAAINIDTKDTQLTLAKTFLKSLIALVHGDLGAFATLATQYLLAGKSPVAVVFCALYLQVVAELEGKTAHLFTQTLAMHPTIPKNLITRAIEIYDRKPDASSRLKQICYIMARRLDPYQRQQQN